MNNINDINNTSNNNNMFQMNIMNNMNNMNYWYNIMFNLMNNYQGMNNYNNNFKKDKSLPFGKLLPRKRQLIKKDLFKTKEYKINIIFRTSTMFEVNLPTPPYITVKELIRNYLRIIGINEKDSKKSIFFLYNAKALDINDELPIESIFQNGSIVNVIENELNGS